MVRIVGRACSACRVEDDRVVVGSPVNPEGPKVEKRRAIELIGLSVEGWTLPRGNPPRGEQSGASPAGDVMVEKARQHYIQLHLQDVIHFLSQLTPASTTIHHHISENLPSTSSNYSTLLHSHYHGRPKKPHQPRRGNQYHIPAVRRRARIRRERNGHSY